MNPSLKNFFNEEKKRVFTPDPFFSTRVLARLGEVRSREYGGIWDVIPGSTKPVFGLALMLMLAFIAVQIFVPQMPEDFVTAALDVDQTDASTLYSVADLPTDHDLLNQLMGSEEQ